MCKFKTISQNNPLNAKLNPIYHLLALLGVHHIFHIRRLRVKAPNLREKPCLAFRYIQYIVFEKYAIVCHLQMKL
jgi:hypothetical protein